MCIHMHQFEGHILADHVPLSTFLSLGHAVHRCNIIRARFSRRCVVTSSIAVVMHDCARVYAFFSTIQGALPSESLFSVVKSC